MFDYSLDNGNPDTCTSDRRFPKTNLGIDDDSLKQFMARHGWALLVVE